MLSLLQNPSFSIWQVLTEGPITIKEGREPAVVVLKATMPPSFPCAAATLDKVGKCRIFVRAFIEIQKKDKCGDQYIPQATVGKASSVSRLLTNYCVILRSGFYSYTLHVNVHQKESHENFHFKITWTCICFVDLHRHILWLRLRFICNCGVAFVLASGRQVPVKISVLKTTCFWFLSTCPFGLKIIYSLLVFFSKNQHLLCHVATALDKKINCYILILKQRELGICMFHIL